MKKLLLIALLTVLTATVGHAAEDIVIDGVVYTYNNGSYIVTGWDEVTPIQSLHIIGEFDDGMVEGIANDAFYGNEDIIYLTIDEGIGYIGQDAFYGCKNIEVAILPEGLVTIEERAFAFCSSLTQFVIPSTVRDIQAQAFMGCTGVTDVYFLMTQASELDEFVWWDGWYQNVPGDYQSSDPHGGIEFNKSRKPYDGDDHRIEHDPVNGTIVHVPAGTYDIYDASGKLEAWLFEAEDDDACHPLWWIVNFGVVGREYTVCDDLTAVYVDVEGGLYAKDDNRWLTPDRVCPGEIDYMKTTPLMQEQGNRYDQSNWVVLKNVDNPGHFMGHLIAGGSIKGTLVDKVNPVIEVSSEATLALGAEKQYKANVFIPAAFMGRRQLCPNEKSYAFVQPKPQEFMHVEWTIYNDEDGCFYLPAPPEPDEEGELNTMHLAGGVKPCYELYEGGINNVPELAGGYVYAFNAINRRMASSQEEEKTRGQKGGRRLMEHTPPYPPYTDGGVSDKFIVYPLELPDEPIITSVTEVEGYTQRDAACWYTIDGRNLGSTKPTAPGIYIKGKSKVVIR